MAERVLIVLGGAMGYGGTEAFLMNYYRHLNRDKIQFDFVYQGEKAGVYDKEITAMGGRIFHVPYKNVHPVGYTRALTKLLHQGVYKVVHAQMDAMNVWPLLIAKCANIPVRISHSHNTEVQSDNRIKKVWNTLAKKMISIVATELWACGDAAAQWLYGKRLCASGKTVVIKNAIDAKKFQYDAEKREKIRSRYGITDAFVVGHVGRIEPQKNHDFLIDVFAAFHKVYQNSRLLLVGDGSLRKAMEEKVCCLGLTEQVVFAGNQKNPSDFYNAMDLFLFPSLWEGLSITFLEAQVNGLFCVCSDTVSSEGYISDVSCVSLSETVELWVETLLAHVNGKRSDCRSKLRERGYDIETEAVNLQQRYLQLIGLRLNEKKRI